MKTKIELSSYESKVINDLIDEFLSDTKEIEPLDEILKYRMYANMLPKRVQERLTEMKIKGDPYTLISGLTVKDLPKTPCDKKSICQANKRYQVALLLFSISMGVFYKFSSKGSEEFVEDVFPIKKNKDKQLGTNSVFLEWHVEDVVHPAKADYVALFCLKDNEEAKTLIFEGAKYFNSSHYKERLSKCSFKVLCDDTFADNFKQDVILPIFDGVNDPEFNYDPHFTLVEDQEDQVEIENLKKFINQNYTEFTLKSGDLLIFDNRRVAHSRTNYSPKFDGSDRWLLRSLIVESTWKLRSSLSNKLLTVV
jgi:L-asparagine oxygenase